MTSAAAVSRVTELCTGKTIEDEDDTSPAIGLSEVPTDAQTLAVAPLQLSASGL